VHQGRRLRKENGCYSGKPDSGGVRRLWAYGCTDYYQQAAPIIVSSPANAKNNILKTAIPLTA
jgi:hypothetical protein